MNSKDMTISCIREFNRFYIVLQGLLNKHFLDSEYSVTEARILYELFLNEQCNASYLVDKLKIDKSYLSRILKKYEKNELIKKNQSESDGRELNICLSSKGRSVSENLIEATDKRISELIDPLSESECLQICESMETITKYFSERLISNVGGNE